MSSKIPQSSRRTLGISLSECTQLHAQASRRQAAIKASENIQADTASTPSSIGCVLCYTLHHLAFVKASGAANQQFMLTSPAFTEYSGSSGFRALSFSYHMYGSSMGSLELQYWTAEHGLDTLWSRSGQQQDSSSSAWLNAQVAVPPLAGLLRFVGTTGWESEGDMAVDNVVASTITPFGCLVRVIGGSYKVLCSTCSDLV